MYNLQTKVSKKKALDIIKSNRVEHEKDYKEAVKEYLKKAEEELKLKLNQIQRGIDINLNISLSKPVQYLTEYDSAIKMLEMTTESTVDMDPQTFDCLINDNWNWKHSFLSNTGIYLKK